jgi:hypothetical protein
MAAPDPEFVVRDPVRHPRASQTEQMAMPNERRTSLLQLGRPSGTAARSGRPDTAVKEIAAEDVRDRHTTTAVVDDISPDGVARIVLSGEERPRDAASVLRFPSAAAASDALLGRTVLVLANPSARPVILGVVNERLWETREGKDDSEVQVELPAGEARSVHVDKRRLNLEAADEIRLTCGKSSLVLRRDGTVVVRGVNVVSRASQSNKIRGGTISLN